MNTNDPQASYGEPMLSDKEMYVNIPQPQFTKNESGDSVVVMGSSKWPVMGVEEVRDFYENLIHEGRLRKVEECRIKIDNSPGEWNGMHLFGCNGRGPVTDEVFCPYCGNKIIKPTNP